MRMGIVMQRRRKRQAALLKRRIMIVVLAAGVLASMGFLPQVQTQITALTNHVQVFSERVQREITLHGYDVYALQLAVFDSGERAAAELKRLQALGIRCVIWQKERMRIVADAAFTREALNMAAAKGQEAYVICDTLDEISLRLSADSVSVEEAKALLELPDVIVQLNADALVDKRYSKALNKWLPYMPRLVLGSDMHDDVHRAPLLDQAIARMEKKRFSQEWLDLIETTTRELLPQLR